ncbi:hypothetical protein PCC7418_3694 [Halothece sp. PCC 7418]|uniref:hypothetical protein n=1 Tax=Halothece sp. (strain PCC 7418) TaxID=65093 RepID=UPI0002A071EF|nr:hypothetical protein [Halothece sp. PCC 7418]AFZ45800.1 hypothetical protein PCC7418_3694 [Halothece sp. PCC 7418]
MFFSELTPILKELTQQPITFTGGLVSGFLRLNPNEDPLKSWLSQQGEASSSASRQESHPPQSIDIE